MLYVLLIVLVTYHIDKIILYISLYIFNMETMFFLCPSSSLYKYDIVLERKLYSYKV